MEAVVQSLQAEVLQLRMELAKAHGQVELLKELVMSRRSSNRDRMAQKRAEEKAAKEAAEAQRLKEEEESRAVCARTTCTDSTTRTEPLPPSSPLPLSPAPQTLSPLYPPSPLKPAREKETSPPGAFSDQIGSVFAEERQGAGFWWTHKDELALRELNRLSSGDESEILRRWRNALRRQRYPTCNSLVELAKNWNAYAVEDAGPLGKSLSPKPQPDSGPTCDTPECGGSVKFADTLGKNLCESCFYDWCRWAQQTKQRTDYPQPEDWSPWVQSLQQTAGVGA